MPLGGTNGNSLSSRSFNAKMTKLFTGAPSGQLVMPTLPLVLERLAKLEQQVAELTAASKSTAK